MSYIWDSDGVLKVGAGKTALYIGKGQEIPESEIDKKVLTNFIKAGKIMKVEYSNAGGKKVIDEQKKEEVKKTDKAEK